MHKWALCGGCVGLLTVGYVVGATGVSGRAEGQQVVVPAGEGSGVSATAEPPQSKGQGHVRQAVHESEPAAMGSATAPAPLGLPPVTAVDSGDIEQLVEQLQNLRARKAELDQQEKKIVAALKVKVKHQQLQLQKLGIEPDEPAKSVVAPAAGFNEMPLTNTTGSAQPKDLLPRLDSSGLKLPDEPKGRK